MLARFSLQGQTGLPTCIMTNSLAKKNPFSYCFSFCVCVIASRNHSPAQQKVPINERCFIKVGSSPWRWQAPLGPVVEIDCNLTKRLWAPDCIHAKVWLGGQGARAGVWAALTLKKVIQERKCPLLFFLPPPLHSSISFHSLINHLVCVLIHLHPVSPLLITPSPLSPPPPSHFPSQIDVRFSLLVSLSFRSPQTYSRSSVSRFAGVCWWLSAALLGGVLGEESICCRQSTPQTVKSVIVFVHPFLGTFRDCAFRTFPRIVVNCNLASCFESKWPGQCVYKLAILQRVM